MAGIFISYRRGDASQAAGRLFDRLAQTFPHGQLFMDIDAIEPGLDFVRVIEARLADCDALLAVIGPNWADARNEDGTRRLDDPDDFVRLELEAALKRDIRVIPVLVDGAQLPRADKLPGGLKPLVRRNAVRLAHERFGAEADDLAQALVGLVKQPAPVNEAMPAQGSADDSTGDSRSTASRDERGRTSVRLKIAGGCSTAASAFTGVLFWWDVTGGLTDAFEVFRMTIFPLIATASVSAAVVSLIATVYLAVRLGSLQR